MIDERYAALSDNKPLALTSKGRFNVNRPKPFTGLVAVSRVCRESLRIIETLTERVNFTTVACRSSSQSKDPST